MKKLMMFAAAMTIVGGAYASCGEVPQGNCALVYDLKISLKTTKANEGDSTTIPCGEIIGAVCYRTVGSVTWNGFLSACACDCISFQAAEVYLWDEKTDTVVANAGSIDWLVLNLIGKKGLDVEAFWTAGGSPAVVTTVLEPVLYAAGFGKWDGKYDRLSSISGNIVGLLPPPDCTINLCRPSTALPCSDLDQDNLTIYTVGSGTWSLKYNSSASKKSADTGVLPFPKWW